LAGLVLTLVRPDGLAVNAGDALNVALALAQTQQGKDGCLLVRLQDVHSMTSTREGRVTSRQTGADDAGLTTRSRSIQVGEFEVAIPGGIWVAIGGNDAATGIVNR